MTRKGKFSYLLIIGIFVIIHIILSLSTLQYVPSSSICLHLSLDISLFHSQHAHVNKMTNAADHDHDLINGGV